MGNNQSVPWQESLRRILDNWELLDPQTLRKRCLIFLCNTAWSKYPLGMENAGPKNGSFNYNQIRSDQLSRVWLFATPWIAARQASLSITNSRSSLRLTSIDSVMPSSHLILYHPLLLLPPTPPRIRVFFLWVNSSHEVAKVLEFQL